MNTETGVLKIGECQIHPSVEMLTGAIIGKPFRRFLDGTLEKTTITRIAQKTYIGCYTTIGTGSIIGSNTVIDDYCIIESRVVLGNHNLITYRAQICNEVIIGNNCVIGGFIGERTRIGSNCRIFGKVVHSQNNPVSGWDDDEAMEKPAVIDDYVFIGFGATIVGNISIGRRVYVCAGAIVTKDIPKLNIVTGINQIIPYSEWKGALRESTFFKEDNV